jgi:hypothetical protein
MSVSDATAPTPSESHEEAEARYTNGVLFTGVLGITNVLNWQDYIISVTSRNIEHDNSEIREIKLRRSPEHEELFMELRRFTGSEITIWVSMSELEFRRTENGIHVYKVVSQAQSSVRPASVRIVVSNRIFCLRNDV